jgi:ATP-dependent Clp protease ATP-binding subunit ClpC
MLRAVFERFSERTRQVIVFAQEESRTLRHDYIGTEHLLLGLLREEEDLAARVLESLDITVALVRAAVVQTVGSGTDVTHGQIPFTPRAKKVLELALTEALNLEHDYIGTEHLLLGLVRDSDSVAAQILLDFDADPEKIRYRVTRLLAAGPPARRQVPGAEMRVALGPDSSIQVAPTGRVRQLLMHAAAQSLDDERTQIELRDLLLALTRDEQTAPLLAELGVDEIAMRNVIDRHAASEEPPEPSSTDS